MSRHLKLQGQKVNIGDVVWYWNHKVRVTDFVRVYNWEYSREIWSVRGEIIFVSDQPRPSGGTRVFSRKVGETVTDSPRRFSLDFEPNRVFHCGDVGWSEFRWLK